MESEHEYALSNVQRSIWEAQQNADQDLYYSRVDVRITGALNEEHLERALQHVINRHEILRTSIAINPQIDEPLQRIHPEAVVTLGLAEDEQERSLTEQPTRISSSLSARLRQHDTNDFMLELTIPSEFADERSLWIVLDETIERYRYLQQLSDEGEQPEAIQYADVAEWLTQLQAENESSHADTYWNSHYATEESTKILAFESRQESLEGQLARSVSERLSPDLQGLIASFEKTHSLTTGTVLLAGWHMLLQRHTQSTKMTVNVAHEGRNYEELELAIGPFKQWLPMTISLSDELLTLDGCQALSRTLSQAQSFQQLYKPGNLRQSQTHFESEVTSAFYFDTRTYPDAKRVGDLSFALEQSLAVAGPFSVGLTIERNADEVKAVLSFDRRAVSLEASTLLLTQYLNLIAGLVDPNNRKLADLVMDRDSALSTEVETFTGNNERSPQSIHQWVHSVALEHPDRIAVVFERQRVSYRSLYNRAETLARALRVHGVSEGDIVAVSVSDGPDQVASFLSVLLTGSAFVMIDPDQVQSRNAQILDTVNPAVVMVDGEYEALVQRDALCTFLEVDSIGLTYQGETDGTDSSSVSNQLAYVVFTSGSTGRPKGVAVTHGSVVAYAQSLLKRLALKSSDQFLSLSSFSADLSYTAVFGALCAGGTLRIVPRRFALDIDALALSLSNEPIDYLKIVPSHYSALLTAVGERVIDPVSNLIFGGEALDKSLYEKINAYPSSPRIYNHYGPSETTIGVAMHQVTQLVGADTDSVPVGHVIDGTTAFILKPDGQRVDQGMPGELLLGGESLARGYLNNPRETAERFVPNPFTSIPGSRVYRTGDWMRRLPDQKLQFINRVDRQVKIRGNRLELGEVEAVLRAQSGIQDAAAYVSQTAESVQSIIVFVTVSAEATVDESVIRDTCKTCLPDYAVPDRVVEVERFPRLPSGKIDWRSLSLNVPRKRRASSDAPPSGKTERALITLWKEILGTDDVRVSDNFFDIGGHSLLVIQLRQKVKETFHEDLPTVEFFKHPTITSLAMKLDGKDSQTGSVAAGQDRAAMMRKALGQNPTQRRTESTRGGR